MSDEITGDDQSHYEISLTAGQAFVAFVLLLLSLAASFGFGLMIGRGQGDDRLVVRKEPTVITEASAVPKKPAGRIVELGLAEDDFQKQATQTDTSAVPIVTEDANAGGLTTTDAAAAAAAAATAAPAQATEAAAAPANDPPKQSPAAAPVAAHPATAPSGPAYAQLLSTGDQKTAEKLAADLIEHGFTSAYVARGATAKGPIFRVRVKFGSEGDAQAAKAKLGQFSKEVWITRQ